MPLLPLRGLGSTPTAATVQSPPKATFVPKVRYAWENPYNGTVSFDNVLQSLELIFVIMSSNTFSDLLYYTADSDYLAAAMCGSAL
jgi:hypothetical protein